MSWSPDKSQPSGDKYQYDSTELFKYEHDKIRKYQKYIYTSLPENKKMIRLMKLSAGEASGAMIFCELLPIEYDKTFHIPTKIKATDAQNNDAQALNTINSLAPCESEIKHQRRLELKALCWEKDENAGIERKSRKLEQDTPETEKEKNERIVRQEAHNVMKTVAVRTKEEERQKTEKKKDEHFKNWQRVKKDEQKYEALSWCWGEEKEDYALLIKEDGLIFRKSVRKELALALKNLRRASRVRYLWVDAVCIDQSNPNERNHQVQMMSRIYTRAKQACIWLGEADEESEIAFKFIRDEMKELRNFDNISSNEQYLQKWKALMSLMQRGWFFRRWVVQEIALARAATVYCGRNSIPWKTFAVAVELFVEVETATHRLSEVMKRENKSRYVPGWFEYVSELGASLLVQATGKVFRKKSSPMDYDNGDYSSDEEIQKLNRVQFAARKKEREEDENKRTRENIKETETIDPLERRGLLSLEYLVSTMFIFKTSEPRDVVYSLLAIARDAAPFAPSHYGHEDRNLFLVMTILDSFLAEKPFMVDYNRPYSDVSRDFVKFSITRKYKIDPAQALDILCRPWALEPPIEKQSRPRSNKASADKEKGSGANKKQMFEKRTTWKRIEKLDNQDKKYTVVEDKLTNGQYWKKYENAACTRADCNHTEMEACWDYRRNRYFPKKSVPPKPYEDIDLPSWVARASQAPFMLDYTPGMDVLKTSRANADPLVGPPQDGHRNFNACGSEKLDLQALRFKKRPVLGHYSLYVLGFVIDEVVAVEDTSQLGSIPSTWLGLGGWDDRKKDPPEEFWRTIVADRGRDNRNPPYYYARACKESVHKGGFLSGSVDTMALVNNEQNSIIAEFCRRVHAVIWNRCLFKTKENRLGVGNRVKTGDKVCILYGCTVPVVLRRNDKCTDVTNRRNDVVLEKEEDRVEALKACIRRAENNRERKAKYRLKKMQQEQHEAWQEMVDARHAYMDEVEETKKKKQKTEEEKDNDAKKERARREMVLAVARSMKGRRDIGKEDVRLIIKDLLPKIDGKGDYQTTLDAFEKEDIDGYIKDLSARESASVVPAGESSEGAEEGTDAGGVPEIVADTTADTESAEAGEPDNSSKGKQAATTSSTTSSDVQENTACWYKFQGECYLHGMMDGEAMREKFYKDLEDHTFELR